LSPSSPKGTDLADTPILENGINPAELAFDLDGVFADTMRLFLQIAHEEFRVDGVRYEDITCYDLGQCIRMDPGIIDAVIAQILEGRHAFPLRPMEHAPQVLSRILERHAPVLFVTARSDPAPVQQWMREVMGEAADAVEVVATGTYDKKAEVLLDRKITYFVEDRLETCFALDAVGVTPILYRQPWNRASHPFIEVGSWRELRSLILP